MLARLSFVWLLAPSLGFSAACSRRAWLAGTCVALGSPRSALSLGEAIADAPSAREAALAQLRGILLSPAPPPLLNSEVERTVALDKLLDELRQLNPTPRPGSVQGFERLAPGSWRVAFAPHITKLSAVASTTFDPIRYVLEPGGSIVSHVAYHVRVPFLPTANGWLSTSGRYGSSDDDTSSVEWDDAWWNPGQPRPSSSAQGAALQRQVSALGRLGFISAFANFPVEYLDRDLCVFTFPMSGTRIAAVREGGSLDVWTSPAQ